MQSAQRPPRFVTLRTPLLDPKTGDVLYDAEVPVPYEVAVEHGYFAGSDVQKPTLKRSASKARTTARRPQANRQAPQGDNR